MCDKASHLLQQRWRGNWKPTVGLYMELLQRCQDLSTIASISCSTCSREGLENDPIYFHCGQCDQHNVCLCCASQQEAKKVHTAIHINLPKVSNMAIEAREMVEPAVVPTIGVKVSFLREFLTVCHTQQCDFSSFTTKAVYERIIQPFTASTGSSFCEILQRNGHSSLGQAKVFVSHVWKYKFVDLVEALLKHFAGKLDTIVWIDIFSMNQHKHDSTRPASMKDFIGTLKHTVLVTSPCNEQLPFTRLWCLWELYSSVKAGVTIHLASKGVSKPVIPQINVESAECYDEHDKASILRSIEQETSFDEFNSTVLSVFEPTLSVDIPLVNEEYECDIDFSEDSSKMQLCVDYLHSVEDTLGPRHPNTLRSMMNLADMLEEQGKFHEASELYTKVIKHSKRALGKKHRDRLTAMNNIAVIYQKMGDYDQALSWFEQCVRKSQIALGLSHVDTVLYMNNLAALHYKRGEYDQAQYLYESCVETQRTWSNQHPDLLTSMHSLAEVYKKLGKYDAAVSLLEQCLKCIKRDNSPLAD